MNNTLLISETDVPLAIFCAVSRIVIAAGYARPLTADINGVMPLASLVGKKKKSQNTDLLCLFFFPTGKVGSIQKLNTANHVQIEIPGSD